VEDEQVWLVVAVQTGLHPPADLDDGATADHGDLEEAVLAALPTFGLVDRRPSGRTLDRVDTLVGVDLRLPVGPGW
jgi:hypothetical protein